MLSALEVDAKARTFDGIFQSWVEDKQNGLKRTVKYTEDLVDTAVKMAFDRQKLECFEALFSLLEPGARSAFLMRMRDPRLAHWTHRSTWPLIRILWALSHVWQMQPILTPDRCF